MRLTASGVMLFLHVTYKVWSYHSYSNVCFSSVSLCFYKLQTSVGGIVNMLMQLTCSRVRLFFCD